MKKLPFQGTSVLWWETKLKKARGIHFLSWGGVELALLILMLAVFIIGVIAQWWLKQGQETVWKILHQNAGWQNMRFGNMGCPCLGKCSNLVWRRGWCLFETRVIQRGQWSPREDRTFVCRGGWRTAKDTELRIRKGERQQSERQQWKQCRGVKQHKVVLWFCDLM